MCLEDQIRDEKTRGEGKGESGGVGDTETQNLEPSTERV